MKLKSFFIFTAAVLAAVSSSFAAEVQMDSAMTFSKPAESADAFRAVVTGEGQLIVKPGKVFSEGSDVPFIQLPYLVSAPKPVDYPRWALHQGWQGELILAVEILTTGRVGRSMVMKSTGHEILDHAALKAVSTWQFQPALREGKPVLTCIQIPVRFQIGTKA